MLETDDGEKVHDSDVKTAPDEIDTFFANNKHKKSLIFKTEKTEDCLDATSNSNFNKDVVEQTILIKTEADEGRNEYGNQDMETIDSFESNTSDKKQEKLKFFSCKKCSFKTTTIVYLRRHYKRTHIEIISQQLVDFTCNKCDFVTKDRKEFDDHLTIHLDTPSSKNENQQNLGFKCDKCDKIFKNKAHLQSHLVSHSDVRPFQCTKCNFKAKTKFVFKKHQLVHKDKSEVQMYSCSKCDYVTKYRYALQDHQLRHVDMSELKTTFECKLCNYVAKFKTELKQHEIVHKNYSESYKCDFCEFVTKQQRTIEEHVRKHHNIKRSKSESNESGRIVDNVGFSLSIDPLYPYQCDKCNFNAKYESSLKEHLLTHSATECDDDERPFMAKTDLSEIDKTFPCDKCEYVGKRKQALKDHEWMHKDSSELEILKCQLCSYVTTRPHYLLGHKRRCHKPKYSNIKMPNDDSIKKPAFYQCDKCDYMAKSKDILNKHQITHSTLKPFKCDKCPYAGKTKIALVCHRSVHLVMSEVEETFPCDMCKYVGKTKKLLLRHRCIYKNGQKLEILKCNLCSFETIHRRGLSLHKLSHSSRLREKLQCNECDFTSNYESRLKKHQVAHSQERPFQCDKCSYKAKTQFDLKMHLETHQKVGLVKCDICNFPTTRITYLKRHYLKVHKKKLLSSNYNFTNSLEDSDIRNEIMQYSNENSSISEESLDMKFEISDTVIDTNVKSEDDLIISIKTEPAEAFDEYNKNFGSTSKSLSEEGIDSKTIFQSENNLSNISEAVENSHCEDKFVDASKIHQLLLDDKLIDSSNKDTNITVSHEYNVSIKTEDPDGTLMPGID